MTGQAISKINPVWALFVLGLVVLGFVIIDYHKPLYSYKPLRLRSSPTGDMRNPYKTDPHTELIILRKGWFTERQDYVYWGRLDYGLTRKQIKKKVDSIIKTR